MKKLFEKHKEVIVYTFVGILTTLVNYIIHFTFASFGTNYYFCVSVSWLGAVIFAYVANRVLVFKSKTTGKQRLKEFSMFIGARIFSYGLEMLISFIFIGCAHADRLVWMPPFSDITLPIGELAVKTASQVVIIVSNYIFSKLVIFKNKNE